MDKEKYLEDILVKYEDIVLKNLENPANKARQPEQYADMEAVCVHSLGSVLSFLNPAHFKEGFYDAVQTKDWQRANDFLYQETLFWLVPGNLESYDQCFYFITALEAYACGAEHVLENIYPYELGLAQNGYPLYVTGSNLLIAKYYNDEEMLVIAIEAANKYVKSKASRWERWVIQFLLDILDKDYAAANNSLLEVCKGYSRVQKPLQSIEDICIPAHGLYCIAAQWLTVEEFTNIKMPNHKAFLQEYAQWRRVNRNPHLKPYMIYPEKMEIINKIYSMPVAKTILGQVRFTEQSKFRPVIDDKKMFQVFVEDLRNYKG